MIVVKVKNNNKKISLMIVVKVKNNNKKISLMRMRARIDGMLPNMLVDHRRHFWSPCFKLT
jgi:hypothetical protein